MRHLVSYMIQFGFIVTARVAIHLAKDHRYHKRTKHIDMRYHKIRQWVVDDKVIDLVKINMKKNPADMMTKTILVKFRASLTFIKVLQK